MPNLDKIKQPASPAHAEKIVLDAAMSDPAVAATVATLSMDCWSDPRHARVAGAIADCFHRLGHAGPVDLAAALGENSPDDYARLVGGIERHDDDAIASALALIGDRAKRVLVADAARKASADAHAGTVGGAELAARLISELLPAIGGMKDGPEVLADIFASFQGRLDELIDPRKAGRCWPTGYYDLDNLLSGGLRPGEMTVIAGRPGSGKSAFAMSVVATLCRADVPCIVYSLEMATLALLHRLLCASAQVSFRRFRRGQLTLDEKKMLVTSIVEIRGWPLYIAESSSASVAAMLAQVKMQQARSGVSVVMVDYLQLANSGSKRITNRNEEVSAVSNGLRRIAKDCNVAVLALSQLNRESERRRGSSSVPLLSDLRDSGQIEQDAHNVLFLHRPEHSEPANLSLKGKVEVHVAKQRDGNVGLVDLLFEGDLMTFRNVARVADNGFDPSDERFTD